MPTHFTLPPRALADAVDLRDLVRLGQVNGLVEQRVPNSAINAPNGVCPLDGDGLVPAADLRFGTTAGTVARGEHLHDARYSRGTVGRFRRTTNSATATTALVAVLRMAAPIVAGRLYRVRSPLLMACVNATATANALAVLTIRATTDGTTPTTTSPLIAQGHIPILNGMAAAQPISGFIEDLYPATVTGTLTLGMWLARGFGNQGVYLLYADSHPIDLMVEDVGVDPGSVGTSL